MWSTLTLRTEATEEIKEENGLARKEEKSQENKPERGKDKPRRVAGEQKGTEERERQTALLMSDIGASPRLSDPGSGMGSPRSPGTSSPRQRLVREV